MLLAGLLLVSGLAALLPELHRDDPPPSFGMGLLINLFLVALLAHAGARIVFRRIGLEPEKRPGEEEYRDASDTPDLNEG
jgi:hypothetical protein